MTTTAARVLDEYAREWAIDQTPAVTSATRGPGALGGRNDQHRRMRVFISFTTAIERDDAPLWLLLLGMPTTASAGAIVEKLPTVTINWTHAFTEAHTRLQRAIERVAAATVSSKQVGSRFGYDEIRHHSIVPETPLVADAHDTSISRGQRALRATNDLANWLCTTPAKVADLLGYKRSYYYWLKDVQPYPATTLNLFEAHSFVAALVDSLGERGARGWLQHGDGAQKRIELLRAREGRDRLYRLSNDLLFPKKEEAYWEPDYALEHDPGSVEFQLPFGELIEIKKLPD